MLPVPSVSLSPMDMDMIGSNIGDLLFGRWPLVTHFASKTPPLQAATASRAAFRNSKLAASWGRHPSSPVPARCDFCGYGLTVQRALLHSLNLPARADTICWQPFAGQPLAKLVAGPFPRCLAQPKPQGPSIDHGTRVCSAFPRVSRASMKHARVESHLRSSRVNRTPCRSLAWTSFRLRCRSPPLSTYDYTTPATLDIRLVGSTLCSTISRLAIPFPPPFVF